MLTKLKDGRTEQELQQSCRKYKKVQNRIQRAVEYNNWTEKYTRRV